MNEKELLEFMLGRFDKIEEKIDEIKSEMTMLKVKVALFSSAIGFIATYLSNKIL